MSGRRPCYMCGVRKSTGSSDFVILHSFPKDPQTRSSWMKFCGLTESLDDVSSLRLCSKHFREENYLGPPGAGVKRRLMFKAVPSIKVFKQQNIIPMIVKKPEITEEIHELNIRKPSEHDVDENDHCTSSSISERDPPVTPPMSNDVSMNPNQESITSVTVNSDIIQECYDTSPRTPKKRRFYEPRFINEIKTPDVGTPRRARRVIAMVKAQDEKKTQKIISLQNQTRYLKKKITSLQDLVKHLKSKHLISETAADTIMDVMPDTLKKMMERKLKGKGQYSPELRTFALTLHFYSPKGYNYVRKRWEKLLPHPSTLRKWYKVVGGCPGFNKEAFDAISLRTNSAAPIFVNLVFDEMAIREQLIYTNGQFVGGVDLGTNDVQDNDTVTMANNALVLMVVAINQHWKVAIGYFLIRALNASERANIIKKALSLLQDCNVKVCSMTFDGLQANFSMCSILGANLNYRAQFKPYFNNPDTNEVIYIFLDICHIIKLIRNFIGDKQILKCGEETIKWIFIQRLEQFQREQGLRAANKLTKKHIKYDDNKMNVKLAFQTLSESVSKSLVFLSELPETKELFQGSDPTSTFCQNINNIADMLNCKNRFSKGQYNCPLTRENFSTLKKYATEFEKYIDSLQNSDGIKLLHTNRKTGFLGLIIGLRNMFSLFEYMELFGIEYLLTYKLCQDYIETFFSAIRSRGGFNNNPNVIQFKAAYKRLLVRHEIKEVENGNCLFDGVEMLHVSSKSERYVCPLQNHHVVESKVDFDHDYVSTFFQLSGFVDNVSQYIAGFVSHKVKKKFDCSICIQHVEGTEEEMPLLSKIKSRGGFKAPSRDVVYICQTAERFLRQQLVQQKLTTNMRNLVLVKVFAAVGSDVFNTIEMQKHILTQSLLDNHRTQLTKIIILHYINVRFHFEAKKVSNKDEYVRHKYTKLVLFKSQ